MRIFIACCLVLISLSSLAQNDSIVTDTAKIHSFKKAMFFSAIVPGAGQVYNHIAMPKGKKKAYWKVPLIYAGLGVTTYFAIYNNNLKTKLRNEIEYRQTDPNGLNYLEYDTGALTTLYVQHRNRRDFAIVGVGLVYILNIIDAGVEAHFVNFNVSKDLSLSIHPVVLSNQTPGLSLSFNFR